MAGGSTAERGLVQRGAAGEDSAGPFFTPRGAYSESLSLKFITDLDTRNYWDTITPAHKYRQAVQYMQPLPRQLALLYKKSHKLMRSADGLQPQEAFDELLKYLFLRESVGPVFAPIASPILGQDYVWLNRQLVSRLRRRFKSLLKSANSWSSDLWMDQSFHLSDLALLKVHEIFDGIDFSCMDIDTRSVAINEFLSNSLRRGLGIFTTPDAVARMMAEIAAPEFPSIVLDPACGTGTFLMEIIRYWSDHCSMKGPMRVWGIDKNARMLMLSELNLGHLPRVKYFRGLADFLSQNPTSTFGEKFRVFDYILTNPPFGVVLDSAKIDAKSFRTCQDGNGRAIKSQQSEVVFVEQCLRYLKPGGLLGIILPRSVITNLSLKEARCAIGSQGYLESAIGLPPETFSASGTQTNTMILFIRRYKSKSELTEKIKIPFVEIENVGFDATGRWRSGSQLSGVAEVLRSAKQGVSASKIVSILPEISKGKSISDLSGLLSCRFSVAINKGIPLSEFVEIATIGKTPGRENYSSSGLFLVKVGNLTGRGISWESRDRNFIYGAEAGKRRKNLQYMLKKNDILLTSSAHSPVYIAKKVDMVSTIPEWVGGEASFVGEVMMIRVKRNFDPFVLLAYLRLPSTRRNIQALIRGQTAHLHPKDLLQMRVPRYFTNLPEELLSLASQIKAEVKIFDKLNLLAHEQEQTSAIVELID